MKVCCTCRVAKRADDFHRNKAKRDGLHNQCKSCRRRHYDENGERIRAYNRSWNNQNRDRIAYHNTKRKMSVGGRARQLWHGAKQRSQDKGLMFDLTIEWIAERIKIGKCERSGVSFDLSSCDDRTNPFAPSIDKIDPHGDYTTENVSVVCWAYNLGKHQMTHEQYVEFCRAVVEFNS